jgi:SpoVK/Ycf46/Vps4 family AAA+-type ATPase
MNVKKGLITYGPPGTGKTPTIRHLAGTLPNHTPLLISAEEVALLSDYLTLARFQQPSVVVIEDDDLIGRERSKPGDLRSEVLLNKLLNEMDSQKEDSEVLFILTKNRPEELALPHIKRRYTSSAIGFPFSSMYTGRPAVFRNCRCGSNPRTWKMVAIKSCG